MVEIKTTLTGWKRKFQGRLKQLYLFTAAQMQTNRGMLFSQSGAYNGHDRWKPLRLRDGQPLKDRGTLSQSIGPRTTGVQPRFNQGTIVRYGSDKVTIGTDLAYARLMNDGGTIVPRKAKLLWIPLPQGKAAAADVSKATKGMRKGQRGSMNGAPIVRLANGKFFMLAKRVVIPPRNFEKWNAADKAELEAALTNEVARCLNE